MIFVIIDLSGPSVTNDYRVVRIATDDDFREYYRTFEMTSLDLRWHCRSEDGS